jgi:WD40 repeat protein
MFRRRTKVTSFVPVWQDALDDHILALAWSPDGRWLAAASVSGPVGVWDRQTGKQRWLLKGHGLGTMCLSWHPRAGLLATGGQDGQVRLWDVATGENTAVLPAGSAWVEQVAWSGLSKQERPLLASAAGINLRFWQEDGTPAQSFTDAPSTITHLTWKPGKRIVAATAYGGARLYHPEQPQPFAEVLAWQGSSLVSAWSPNGRMLATGDQDSTVHFWYVQEKRDLQMWGYQTKVRELAWDRQSRYLATGGGDSITVWDCGQRGGPEGTRPQQLIAHQGFVSCLAYQVRGDQLLSAGEDGLLVLWEPQKQLQPMAVEPFMGGVSTAVWSPDDQQIAVGLDTGEVQLLGLQ